MTTFLKDLIKKTCRKTHGELQDNLVANLKVLYRENVLNKPPLKGPLLSRPWKRSRGFCLMRVSLHVKGYDYIKQL